MQLLTLILGELHTAVLNLITAPEQFGRPGTLSRFFDNIGGAQAGGLVLQQGREKGV